MHRWIGMAAFLALIGAGTPACNDDGGTGDGPGLGDGGSPDGGRADSGAPGSDAGTSGDGGATSSDGGSTPADATVPDEDAGSTPECTYEDLDVCGGDPDMKCGNGRCVSCESGFFNCDMTRGCECEGGCDGTQCPPENACEGGVANECGSSSRWCYEGAPGGIPQCRDCSDGFLNCDGLNGCEHTCEEDPCEPCPGT